MPFYELQVQLYPKSCPFQEISIPIIQIFFFFITNSLLLHASYPQYWNPLRFVFEVVHFTLDDRGKGKVKVKFSLCFFLTEHAMKAYWGSRYIAVLIL